MVVEKSVLSFGTLSWIIQVQVLLHNRNTVVALSSAGIAKMCLPNRNICNVPVSAAAMLPRIVEVCRSGSPNLINFEKISNHFALLPKASVCSNFFKYVTPEKEILN